MNKDTKISHLHLRGLIVSSVIGVGILSVPNTLADTMGSDGWISIIIAGMLMIPLLLMYNQIFKLYPGMDIFEIGKATLGSFFFTIVMIIGFSYLIVSLAVVIRTLGELIKIFLLQTTPLEFIVITFIIASSYIATYEIDVIARAGYFVYPIIIAFAFIIVLIAIPGANFENILPVFRFSFKDLLKGTGNIFFSFAGMELIFFAIPYVEDKQNIVKSGVLGIMTITIIYTVIFIMSLAHFSLNQLEHQVYPVLMLIRQLDLPGFFLENLDGLIMALWVIVVFSTVAPLYFGAGKVLSKLFKTKSHKYFIWALIPVIYFIAMLPENFIQLLYDLRHVHDILAVISIVLLPLLILIVGSIRKKVER
jgi:spore germination protein